MVDASAFWWFSTVAGIVCNPTSSEWGFPVLHSPSDVVAVVFSTCYERTTQDRDANAEKKSKLKFKIMVNKNM